QKIWNGVIRHATPKEQRRQQEEWVWVPGPWHDPALLEWKQGGRVELRIFPIPAHGTRRVVLAYTQPVPSRGVARRWTYALPQGNSSPADHFAANLWVANDQARALGYPFQSAAERGGTRMHFSANGFVPNGDLIVDFTPRHRQPISWWTYGDTALFAIRPQ